MIFLTENDRRNTLVGGLTLFALLFVCMATTRLYEVVVPVHVEHDTINITMADYEKALATWKSKEPQEYLITTTDGTDIMTLRVRPKQGEVEVTSHTPGVVFDLIDIPGFPPFRTAGHDAQQRTVDGLFATAKEMLDLVTSGPMTGRQGDIAYFQDFKTEFDVELGYPKKIEHRFRTSDPGSEITWRKYVRSSKKVEKLEIVR